MNEEAGNKNNSGVYFRQADNESGRVCRHQRPLPTDVPHPVSLQPRPRHAPNTTRARRGAGQEDEARMRIKVLLLLCQLLQTTH